MNTSLRILPQRRPSYNGNNRLKQLGFAIDYEAWQIEEILRCTDDPIYFIETYCKIVSLDRGLVPFTLYECQKEKVHTILNNRKVILMEGRQQGKTITSAACILWYTLFQDNKTVAILANKAAAAREVLSRYQGMYENLPLWLQQGVKEWNKGSIELENGSKVFTAATAASGIRGKSVNWLYIDEAAIIPNNIAEEFFTSTYPTIMAGETTKVLMSSTPLGYNHFWKFWNDSEQGINDFVRLYIPYTAIPGRDEKWADEQRGVLGDVKFTQEVLCHFLGSSYTLIDAKTLGNMSPRSYVYSKNDFDVIEEPIRGEKDAAGNIVRPDNTYVICADTSRGVGGDYHAFTVIDITSTPYRVVAKYRNNRVAPVLYPSFIHTVAKNYNNAFVLVEINDNGQQVADILYNEMEYENLLFVNRDTQIGQMVGGGFGRHGQTQNGVRTDKKVKRIGCSMLKTLIESGRLEAMDKDIISEFSTFVEDNKGTYSADEGYHDDLVMTLVLFAWMTTNSYFRELTDMNIRTSLFENQIRQIESELTPFGFIDDGSGSTEPKYIYEAGDLWTVEKRAENWL
jgi:hypothetical protein